MVRPGRLSWRLWPCWFDVDFGYAKELFDFGNPCL